MLARRNGLAYVGMQNTEHIQIRSQKMRMGVVSGPLGRKPAHALGFVLGAAERLEQRKSLLRIRLGVGKRSEQPAVQYLFVTPDSPVMEAATEKTSTSHPKIDSKEGGSTPSPLEQ